MNDLSRIDRTAQWVDKLRFGGGKVDFDAYMKTRQDDAALIKPVGDYRAELQDVFFGEKLMGGYYPPWQKADGLWRIRRREVSTWLGFNGHGKSMCLGYVALALLEQHEKVCILSFEMPVYATLGRMARQAAGTSKPTTAQLDHFTRWLTDKLWLYDQTGDVTPERVVAVITYAAEQLGCTQFVVDSLMKVVGDEDDYNGQKRFVGKMCQLAKDLNLHIHLVHHSRKREDESKRPGKQDAKGSGAVIDQVDNAFSVFRLPEAKAKPGEDKSGLPTHMLYLDKQRHGEFEGAFALWFDKFSFQFKEAHHHPQRVWLR